MNRLPTLAQRIDISCKHASGISSALASFRDLCFKPQVPCFLPAEDRTSSSLINSQSLAAFHTWFSRSSEGTSNLRIERLMPYASTRVPVELTSIRNTGDISPSFSRQEMPLGLFLAMTYNTQEQKAIAAEQPLAYLAQCPLTSLPRELQDDLPTPVLVKQAGKGDVYDTNVWMGMPPTNTPLHKDPNPNLLLQLAGTKIVRMFTPALGLELFNLAQQRAGTASNASLRGEEMMVGPERVALDDLVWSDETRPRTEASGMEYEAIVEAGDAVFIPKGWWHSIRSHGAQGISASVNWWFR